MLIVLTNQNGQEISVNPNRIEKIEPYSSKSNWTRIHFASRAIEVVQQTQAEIRALCGFTAIEGSPLGEWQGSEFVPGPTEFKTSVEDDMSDAEEETPEDQDVPTNQR